MLQKIASLLFILTVFGVLIAVRFDVPPSAVTIVTHTRSSSSYKERLLLKRGQFIKTAKGEFVAIEIGKSIRVALDENTTIELKRTFLDERTIGFTRGRIVVTSIDQSSLRIETNQTRNVVQNATASFVNYDFRDTVTLIPIRNTIQTTIKGTNMSYLVTSPVNIHETNPIPFEPVTFQKNAGMYAAFYDWVDQLDK